MSRLALAESLLAQGGKRKPEPRSVWRSHEGRTITPETRLPQRIECDMAEKSLAKASIPLMCAVPVVLSRSLEKSVPQMVASPPSKARR
jgi:hypothetical protein